MSSALLVQARHPAAEQKHVLYALQNKQADKQDVQLQLATASLKCEESTSFLTAARD